MIVVELHHHNKKVDSVKIDRTELTAPTVIFDRHQGKFFVKLPVDPRITAGTPNCPLQYRQCRGEVLSNIEVVRSASAEEVA
jgi:hypothetical protein